MPQKPKQRPRSGHYDSNPEGALERASSDLLRKVPPQNLEAEQAVIGGVFQSNTMFHELVDLVDADDFYSPAHRTIFQAFIDLYNKQKPIDLVTVKDHLESSGTLETIGGRSISLNWPTPYSAPPMRCITPRSSGTNPSCAS